MRGFTLSFRTLTNNREILFISVFKHLPLCGAVYSKRPRHGRDDCLREQERDGIYSFSRFPVNKMTSKARAGTRRACDRRWQRRDRHEPPGREKHKFPYRRVKGGYCGHGLGSLVTCRHLLSVSWRLCSRKRLGYSCAGGEQ